MRVRQLIQEVKSGENQDVQSEKNMIWVDLSIIHFSPEWNTLAPRVEGKEEFFRLSPRKTTTTTTIHWVTTLFSKSCRDEFILFSKIPSVCFTSCRIRLNSWSTWKKMTFSGTKLAQYFHICSEYFSPYNLQF